MEKAWAWAESHKRCRVNPVHGESEAYLVLSDGFCVSATDIEENVQEGRVDVEDNGSL